MTRPAPGLVVAILTLNEEGRLGEALQSIGALCPVLVVDSGSTDRTHEVAVASGADLHWVVHSFEGFGAQRAHALTEARRLGAEWVLFLDADERLTPAFVDELGEVLDRPSHNGYEVRFSVWFLGRYLDRGAYARHRVLRLARLESVRSDGAIVNERLAVDGSVGRIGVPILHNDALDVRRWTEKQNAYSTLESMRFEDEVGVLRRPSLRSIIWTSEGRRTFRRWAYYRLPLGVRPVFNFGRVYFFNQGFREGVPGLVHAVLWGLWHFLLIDVKVWERRHVSVDG